MNQTRFQKIEQDNLIEFPDGKKALSVGLHIVHEVTSAQAFVTLEKMNMPVKRPQNTFAVTDHVVHTGGKSQPNDIMDDILIKTLEDNCYRHGITHYGVHNGKQGICHVVAPDVGLTLPNITIFCGDSHTSTHGAFGTIAAGIGTSTVRDILATGTLLNYKSPQQMKVQIDGPLPRYTDAKDLILFLLSRLGNEWATGGAVFFTGSTIAGLSMEERMTICNMTIEMGGRFGYCDVDETTFSWYRENRDFHKASDLTEEVMNYWLSYNCDSDAVFNKEVRFESSEIKQMISFGLTLNDIVNIRGQVGQVENVHPSRMAYEPHSGEDIDGLVIHGAFIGSCTNGRYSDFKAAAEILQLHGGRVKVEKALAVPGSIKVKRHCEAEGLDKIFTAAGFEWRDPGCSSCLAMNPDKFEGRVASSTNRNFPGRQGPQSRTFLMSPRSVALAALNGKISDIEKFYHQHSQRV